MGRDESVVQQMEDKIIDLLEAIHEYGDEMQKELLTRDKRDPVAKLASFQVTRVEWLQDLGGQIEEIVRDMLDRVQQVDLAEAGRFTGKADDVIQTNAEPHRPASPKRSS